MARFCYGIRRVLSTAVVLSVFLLFRPAVEAQSEKEDSSCHNPFVNGVTRVSARFSVDLLIEVDDWPELTRLLEDFASTHGWSFRNTGRVDPGVLKTMYLSLCAENRVRIHVAEQRWAFQDYGPAPGRGVGVPIYGDVPEFVWRPVAVEIVEILETRWPDGVRFRGGDGRLIDRPEFLSVSPKPAE